MLNKKEGLQEEKNAHDGIPPNSKELGILPTILWKKNTRPLMHLNVQYLEGENNMTALAIQTKMATELIHSEKKMIDKQKVRDTLNYYKNCSEDTEFISILNSIQKELGL